MIDCLISSELIITYQVITGNYSFTFPFKFAKAIITYQVITGNYSQSVWESFIDDIITYREFDS